MITILALHSDEITLQGIEAFLANPDRKIYTVRSYADCLNSAKFLEQTGEKFVVLAEGKLLDTAKCSQLVSFSQAKLILCDLPANQSSLLLALNFNSSYISLEHNDPRNLNLAIECVSMGNIFVCSQAQHQVKECVFSPKLKEREAINQLEPIDQQILALLCLGHTHSSIGKLTNYSALNISYRLKNVVQKLNLQNKQEAIALATNIGLGKSCLQSSQLQTA